MHIGDGAAWRGFALRGGRFGRNRGRGGGLAGEGGAWPAALARPAQSSGGRVERERVERERDLTDSNLIFSQNFQLTLEKF